MRHRYELSPATIKVLTNRTEAIAAEMDIDPANLRQILNGSATDRFSSFRHLYAAAVRAGAPVCHWDNELASIRAKYEAAQAPATPMECLSKQIQNSASVAGQIVQALQDGQIDQSEATKILEAVRQERQTLDLIETTVTYAAILPLEVRREAKVRRVL